MTAPRDILALLDPLDNGRVFEAFLDQLLEHDDDWKRSGRSSDGVEHVRVVESSSTRVRICGRVWEISKQTLHAFWLDLEREHEAATEARWEFYFHPLESKALEKLASPEHVNWRVVRSGRALIREREILLASVDGHDEAPSPTPVVDTSGTVQLVLEAPHHGWLPVRLRLGTFELVDDASGVLNDPVLELMSTIEALTRGEPGTARICFWSEPGGYAVDIETVPGADVAVNVYWDGSFVPPMAKRRMQQEWTGIVPRAPLLAELRSALSLWLERIDDKALAHWAGQAADYRHQLRSRLGEPGG